MEIINYANGSNMTLPQDAQIVQGVSGNAVYLPAGAGTMPIAGNRNELTISLWRQWDGVVEADDYRGIFKTANIKAYFDQATDFLTIELAGVKTVTDIRDDQEQTHWCFLFSKNGFFKIYKNAELKTELTAGNYPVDFSEGFTLGGGRTHATFDEVRMYKSVVTEPEIMGLYRLVTKGTQVQQLKNIVTEATPKYLGVVETVPDTKTAIITKGERLGAVDANPGDWVLSGRTIGSWKVGVCYRWSGAQWLNLQPEVNYAKEYQACLVHLFEIEELKQQTGHFGALFAKVLVAQKAMIDELLVNQAFIKNLVVRKLRIDTIEGDEHNDFEAWFDETNGLKIRNKGEEIFRVDTNGNIFAQKANFKDAYLTNAYFEGEIHSGPLHLSSNTPANIILNLTKGRSALEVFQEYNFFDYKCQEIGGGISVYRSRLFEYKYNRPYYASVAGHDMKVGYQSVREYVLAVYYNGQVDILAVYGEIYDSTKTYWGWSGSIPSSGVIKNQTIYRSHKLQVITGGKTFKLLDLPSAPTSEKGAVWVNEEGYLKISR